METKVKRMNLSTPQKEAIRFIGLVARISRVNPYPVHRSTLRRLIELRIVELTLDKCDYKLTNRGRNICLGL